MKRWVLIVALIGLSGAAHGQLRIGFKVVEPNVLRYEPIRIRLQVQNDTDEMLFLDEKDSNARLYFRVTSKNGGAVRRRDKRRISPRVLVRPGVRKEFKINLTPLFELSKEGRYLVTGYIEWGETTYATDPVVIDVSPGLEISTQTKTVPGYRDRRREYSLRYWHRNGEQLLFLSVDDLSTGANYGVFPLGPFMRLRGADPVVSFGVEGDVSIKHQLGARVFVTTYLESVVDGVRYIKQEYHDEKGKPLKPGDVVEDTRPTGAERDAARAKESTPVEK